MALLWPESDPEHARHSLNEAVRRLRQGLGADRLLSRGDTLTLADRDLDLELEAPAAEPEGELLEGLSFPDAPAFDDWLGARRTELAERRVSAALARGEEALAEVHLADAGHAARHALAVNPLSEPAVALTMRAAALAGDATGALKAYRDFEGRLERELGERPGRELAALAGRIRGDRWRSAVPADQVTAPLVGRAATHGQVFRIVRDAFGGNGRTLAIAGGSGMGKSRLISEIAERWTLDGGVAVTTRLLVEDRDTPWSGLRHVFRAGLATAPGLPAASPRALEVLGTLVPELARRAQPRQGDVDVAEVAAALAAALDAAAGEAPVAILLDDAQAADHHTLAALGATCPRLAGRAVLIGLAAPFQADDRPELIEFAARIGREAPGAIAQLPPLEPADSRALVDAMAPWCYGPEQHDRLARRLHFETAGSPALLVAVLRGLAEVVSLRGDALVWPPPKETLDAPMPPGATGLVRLVTRALVSRLASPARDLFVSACLGPRVVDTDVASALAGLDASTMESALAELERRGLLAFDGQVYVLPIPLLARGVATEFLTPGQRQRLLERQEALRARRLSAPAGHHPEAGSADPP
jgi:DNA-binding SARP family transcriptional activator